MCPDVEGDVGNGGEEAGEGEASNAASDGLADDENADENDGVEVGDDKCPGRGHNPGEEVEVCWRYCCCYLAGHR